MSKDRGSMKGTYFISSISTTSHLVEYGVLSIFTKLVKEYSDLYRSERFNTALHICCLYWSDTFQTNT